MRAASDILKNPQDFAGALQQLKDKEAAAQKEIEALRKEKAMHAVKDLENSAVDHAGVRAIVSRTALDAGSVKGPCVQTKIDPKYSCYFGQCSGRKSYAEHWG